MIVKCQNVWLRTFLDWRGRSGAESEINVYCQLNWSQIMSVNPKIGQFMDRNVPVAVKIVFVAGRWSVDQHKKVLLSC